MELGQCILLEAEEMEARDWLTVGLLLEGHGWWHLMTGYGAYFYIVWGIWLRHCLNGRQDDFELVWPSLWTSIPIVVKRSMANGSVKKDS